MFGAFPVFSTAALFVHLNAIRNLVKYLIEEEV